MTWVALLCFRFELHDLFNHGPGAPFVGLTPRNKALTTLPPKGAGRLVTGALAGSKCPPGGALFQQQWAEESTQLTDMLCLPIDFGFQSLFYWSQVPSKYRN